MLLYPIGVPVILFSLLADKRDEPWVDASGVPDETIGWAKRLEWAHSNYEEEYWWFEVYELVRKLAMTGIIIFIAPSTATQIATGMLMSMVALLVQAGCAPFDGISDDVVSTSMGMSITCQMFMGLIYKTGLNVTEGYNGGVFTQLQLAVNYLT